MTVEEVEITKGADLRWKSGQPMMLTPAVTRGSAKRVCHVEWPPRDTPRHRCWSNVGCDGQDSRNR